METRRIDVIDEHKDRRINEDTLEVVGVFSALKSGVSPDAVRRPLVDTDVVRDEKRGHSKVGTCSVQAVG
jgi:hypothetical protein